MGANEHVSDCCLLPMSNIVAPYHAENNIVAPYHAENNIVAPYHAENKYYPMR